MKRGKRTKERGKETHGRNGRNKFASRLEYLLSIKRLEYQFSLTSLNLLYVNILKNGTRARAKVRAINKPLMSSVCNDSNDDGHSARAGCLGNPMV